MGDCPTQHATASQYPKCGLSICQLPASALVYCKRCCGLPQTDPDVPFPDHGYCSQEHLNDDTSSHRQVCNHRMLPLVIGFVDCLVNAICLEERLAMHCRVVTAGPIERADGTMEFIHHHMRGPLAAHQMFPSGMADSDKLSTLFYHQCVQAVRTTSGVVALCLQGLPVELLEMHTTGVIPAQVMVIRGEFPDEPDKDWLVAEYHTMIHINPTDPTSHESIQGGVNLDPSRPQYRFEPGAVKWEKYPIESNTKAPISQKYGAEYKRVKEGRYNDDMPLAPSRTECMIIEASARIIHNAIWDMIQNIGELGAIRDMDEKERTKIIEQARMRTRDGLERLRVRYDEVYYPVSSSPLGQDEILKKLEAIMEGEMGDGHRGVMRVLEQVTGEIFLA